MIHTHLQVIHKPGAVAFNLLRGCHRTECDFGEPLQEKDYFSRQKYISGYRLVVIDGIQKHIAKTHPKLNSNHSNRSGSKASEVGRKRKAIFKVI